MLIRSKKLTETQRLERQKEAHENGEAEALDKAAEVALDIAKENKKNPNAWPRVVRVPDDQCRLFKGWVPLLFKRK